MSAALEPPMIFPLEVVASELGEYAWYFDKSSKQTHTVGKKKPNAWGLFDMHGNVSEWVEDDLRIPDGGITAGDFTGDGKADVASSGVATAYGIRMGLLLVGQKYPIQFPIV